MASPTGPVTVTSPLGPDVFAFRTMNGVEAIGQPFEYVVDLVSANANIQLNQLIGKPMVVHLEVATGVERHFHGFVTAVDFLESAGSVAAYRVILRPWLWLLTQTTNCRIFQHQTVPGIVKQVFRDHGFTDFSDSLHGEYPKAEYIVQYRESDFNFVSRLLESAGIYYFFRHTAQTHTLVLGDSHSAHQRIENCKELPFRPHDEHMNRLVPHVDGWQLHQAMTSGKVALRDFDFERPRANLSASASTPKGHAHADFEVYDYPGDYRVRADGEARARVRLEQRQVVYAQVHAHTNARPLAAGGLFALTDHPRDDQNGEYLVTFTQISISGHEMQSGTGNSASTFSCDFEALGSRLPFRVPMTARKPIVEGPQTAMVVGDSGDIWTDKYGRIKVQFHWDRDGKHDVNSSCWMRVSEAWAGAGWGSMHLPHLGQEVIVSFLEGDPDRPIVTGRVYDANNMPWQSLPAEQKKSYFRDEGQNHFMMDATKGKERIELYSPFANTKFSLGAPHNPDEGASLQTAGNYTARVARNQDENIGGDKKQTVGGDEKKAVEGDSTLEVFKNMNESIKNNIKRTCGGHLEIKVGDFKNELTVGASTDVYMGLKHESFFGVKTEVSLSKAFKTVYASESGKNYAEQDEWAKGHVTKRSEESYVISVGESGGMLHLDTETAIISAEGISIRVDGKTKKIIIKAEDEIRLKAKKIKLTADDGLTIHAQDIKIDGGPLDVSSNLKVIP